MILVDSAVWVDHIRSANPLLGSLLQDGRVLTHPCVICEIALGSIRDRANVLAEFDELPHIQPASDQEVRHMIEVQNLASRGIGYVDAHLLAAVRLAPGTSLWTRDKRLLAAAEQLAVAAQLLH